jgi:hypothetical protein
MFPDCGPVATLEMHRFCGTLEEGRKGGGCERCVVEGGRGRGAKVGGGAQRIVEGYAQVVYSYMCLLMDGQPKFNLINICKILYCPSIFLGGRWCSDAGLPEAAMVCAILLQSRGLKKDDIVLLKILFFGGLSSFFK